MALNFAILYLLLTILLPFDLFFLFFLFFSSLQWWTVRPSSRRLFFILIFPKDDGCHFGILVSAISNRFATSSLSPAATAHFPDEDELSYSNFEIQEYDELKTAGRTRFKSKRCKSLRSSMSVNTQSPRRTEDEEGRNRNSWSYPWFGFLRVRRFRPWTRRIM